MAMVERGVAAFLVSPDWEPFYPMHFYGVFASRWPKDGKRQRKSAQRSDHPHRRCA